MDILQFLSDLKQERFVYVPNPGNAGDSVIAAATYQTFDRLGLKYDIAPPGNIDFAGRTLVYGGGGNLVKPTSYSARVVARHHKYVKRLVILPHTIKEVDDLLRDFGGNVDIFCREQVSFDYVSTMAPRARVYLAHDMAFLLDTDAVLATPTYARRPSLLAYLLRRYIARKSVPALGEMLKAQTIGQLRRKVANTVAGGDFYCFRGDGERAGSIAIPRGNVDLSTVMDFGVETPETAYLATYHVLDTLRSYGTVHTDRLHIAISSALLGKSVRFHDNNYYKCREVYRHSMRDRFPNVVWCGAG